MPPILLLREMKDETNWLENHFISPSVEGVSQNQECGNVIPARAEDTALRERNRSADAGGQTAG